MKNSNNYCNALFIQRFIAFLIDMMIISFVSTLLSFSLYDSSAVEKLANSNNEIIEKYMNKEISMRTYITESIDITYELARKNGIISLVTIFLSILYFVCYQFYRNGRTVGKKMMGIQVISNNDNELVMNNYIFRSLIINYILFDMISLCFIIFASKDAYFYGVGFVRLIQYVIMFVGALMVMFRKDCRGIHDLIANTRVVRIDKVKELEVCEN